MNWSHSMATITIPTITTTLLSTTTQIISKLITIKIQETTTATRTINNTTTETISTGVQSINLAEDILITIASITFVAIILIAHVVRLRNQALKHLQNIRLENAENRRRLGVYRDEYPNFLVN